MTVSRGTTLLKELMMRGAIGKKANA